MTSEEWDHLAKAWIENYHASYGKLGCQEQEWAADKVADLMCGDRWEALTALNYLAHATYGDMSFGLLGAGPLEDLISDHGDEIVPEIEYMAHDNPVFRALLGCIYRRKSLSDDS
ncbi:MAG: hypothetical protein EOP85_16540 [Verrucomicrobiaceae bacterium]|nr:MAG: hypothetical protein EOP85_16540 [Verrucomicrobiaceae bacterium]